MIIKSVLATVAMVGLAGWRLLWRWMSRPGRPQIS